MTEISIDGRKVRNTALAGTTLLAAGMAFHHMKEGKSPEEQVTPIPPKVIEDIFTEHNVTIASPEMFAEASQLYGGSEKQWRIPYSGSGDPIAYALYFDGTIPNEQGERRATIQVPEGTVAHIVKAEELGDKAYVVVGDKDLTIPDVKTALVYFQESPVTKEYDMDKLAGQWREERWDTEKNDWISKTDWEVVRKVTATQPIPHPKPTSVPAEVAEQSMWSPEQQRLIEVTARHLTKIYGDSMDSSIYPDEASKYAFFTRVTEIGLELNPNNPNLGNQIAAVMNFESGFSPSIENPDPRSDATGLLQFMGDTAIGMGTSTEALKDMTPIDQLYYCKKYLANNQPPEGYTSVYDVYMSVLWPAGIGHPPSTAIMQRGDGNYEPNSGLDRRRDGDITIEEAAMSVMEKALLSGEFESYLTTSND